MDATTETLPDAAREDYKSRPGALIWFFRKSRDRWKAKYSGAQGLRQGPQEPARRRHQEPRADGGPRPSAPAVAPPPWKPSSPSSATGSRRRIQKNGPGRGPLNFTPQEHRVPRGQHYAVGVVLGFLALVLGCGASLRCAAGVLGWLGSVTGREDLSPHGSTGRLWLLRLGLAALPRPKVVADDWVWMIDHSIQIGTCKCLVILGIRLSELPEGRPLGHRDMEPIALVPMTGSTKQTVAVCLEEAVARTGVPRVILDDHGADLHGGVEIFRAAHPETIEMYDIKHKAACLLKARLEGDERWKSYATGLGQAKFAVQQTELACLVPPSQRSKARFMNLGELVDWGVETLALVDDPARLEPLGISAERVRAKLGWLADYREALAEWSAYQEVIDGALDFVRRRGLYPGAGFDLAAALPAATGRRRRVA